jgi:hypothetical protein
MPVSTYKSTRRYNPEEQHPEEQYSAIPQNRLVYYLFVVYLTLFKVKRVTNWQTDKTDCMV